MYYKKEKKTFMHLLGSKEERTSVSSPIYTGGREERIKEENEAPESDIDGSAGVGSSSNR